ncbi:MAG: HEAT repeat domain-containing protein [Candidatus Dormibacteraceae bacterium]
MTSLTASNPAIRATAVMRFEQFGAAAKPGLAPLLQDRDPFVRQLATRAMKRMEAESATKTGER